jgi:hypothetical protein
MAGVTCTSCGEENAQDNALCRTCGLLLVEDGSRPEPVPAETAPSRSAARPEVGTPFPAAVPDACPACSAEVPDPANLVCVECLEPLSRSAPPARPVHTRREAGALRLLFGAQPIDVPRPGAVLLGRDPGQSSAAEVFSALDNVSRRHASVGVDADGSAWVRDEHSTNGTFVNDAAVPAGRTRALAHGDRLRLGSDVVARVELHTGGLR